MLVPATLALGAWLALWVVLVVLQAIRRKRLGRLLEAWGRYASTRQLQVASSDGPPEARAPLVEGDIQGVRIGLFIESADPPRTRIEGALPGVTSEFVMAIRRRSDLTTAELGAQLSEARTGNRAFDSAFTLLSNEPDLARSLVDRRLAQVVGAFPRPFTDLSARENRLVLTWVGMETDANALDAAVELVFTACRRRA